MNRMPFLAPLPLPTIMATGVASPSAQGHEMTRTATARDSAYSKPLPIISQITNVTSAIPMTTGTKTALTRSAALAMGALVAAASLTMWMIWESVVSSPTRVARQRRKPDWFTVAALTVSPSALSTGMLSPVRALSLTALSPLTTTPSTGIFSPGRTTKMSPILTSSISTVTSLPSRSSVACFGDNAMRDFRASVVLPLDRDSSTLPMVMSTRIIAADSK